MIASWKFEGGEQIEIDGSVHRCLIYDREDGISIGEAFDSTPYIDDPDNRCPMCGSMTSSVDGIVGRVIDIKFNVPFEIKVGMRLTYSRYICGTIVAWWETASQEPARLAAIEWPPPESCNLARIAWLTEYCQI